MRRPLVRRLATAACLAAAMPAVARAEPPQAGPPEPPRVLIGGEVAASIAPEDDEAFFNYTDYEQDGLRLARFRLLGEWRAADTLRLVGELRLENGRDVEVAAWYLRWRPRSDWPLDVQAGRIPPVIGAFPRRAYGRDNAVMGAPLMYQYLTSLRADAAPASADDLLRMRGRGWQPIFPIGSPAVGPGLALVSSTEWGTGAQAIWHGPRAEIAGAVTRGAPSEPAVFDEGAGVQWSGRAAVDLPGGARVGLSAARGRWLDREVLDLLPDGSGRDGTQTVAGADAEYGYGRWLVRAEWLRAGYALPLATPAGGGLDLSAHSGYVEARWRPHPRWQVAARAEYLRFSQVAGQALPDGPWDAPVERLEAAGNYRVNRHLDVRAGWQQNWRGGGRIHRRGFPVVAVLYWF